MALERSQSPISTVIIKIAFFSLGCLFVNSSPAPINFRVLDFELEDSKSPSKNAWRGYKFTVNTEVIVSQLIGGATEAGFHIAIFELEAGSNQLINLEGFVALDAGASQTAALDIDIHLRPEKVYYLSQGRSTGSGNHFLVNFIDIEGLKAYHSFIETWLPTSFRVSASGHPENLISASLGDTSNDLPAIGFVYTLVDIFATTSASPSGKPSATSSSTPARTQLGSTTPTLSPSLSTSSTAIPSATNTRSQSWTVTPTFSPTPSPSLSSAATPSATNTRTQSWTTTPTASLLVANPSSSCSFASAPFETQAAIYTKAPSESQHSDKDSTVVPCPIPPSTKSQPRRRIHLPLQRPRRVVIS